MPVLAAVLIVVLVIVILTASTRGSMGPAPGEKPPPPKRPSQEGRSIKEIEDPRLAATVMMHGVALSEGGFTEGQRDLVLELMRTRLRMNEDQAVQMFESAAGLTPDLFDLSGLLLRLATAVAANCTPDERGDLVDMLEDVAVAIGPATDEQRRAIDLLAKKLDVTR